MDAIRALEPASLYRNCDPDQFAFETTAELPEIDEVIGQPRAVEAVRFGIGIQQDGYNIFALGPAGTGKRSILEHNFMEEAAKSPVPSDWCYVHNFEHEHQPKVLELPPGRGTQFCQDIDNLVDELRNTITSAFESDEYRTRRQLLEQEFKERQEQVFEKIQEEARERQLMVLQTPSGLAFAPTREGQVLPPEEFQQLPPEDQKVIEKNISTLQEAMQTALEELPRWQKEMRSRLRALNKEVTAFAAGGLIDDLRKSYADFSAVIDYLAALENDVIENARGFLAEAESAQEEASQQPNLALTRPGRAQGLTRRYQVNILIDNSQSTSAPVIYEDNPTVQNLIGRVEHMAQMGALVTDFNLIKPGCLHKANGGYLILDARKIIGQPLGWESLKRALRSGQIQIESAGQIMGLTSTISLGPEPIPLKLKVALLGDRELYFLLSQFDPDFNELFKVAADFDEYMEHSDATLQKYAQLIGTLAHQDKLRPLHKTAVARVIEHSGRMIGDSERLSAMMNTIADLLREADYWASEADEAIVRDEHVQQAIDAKVFRLDRMRSRMQEMVVRETILIDTTGEAVGQINGLSVLAMGGLVFGKPSRITARVRLGKGEVIDIEREVELGGALHSKGVLILSSFLGSRYTPDIPLSLSASLVFEQSYGGVDGDSASSTELYALLSAISEIPLKQSLAVTGSVNQHGQVQAIGGVNEKIEGFFDLCNTRGLSGDQGVIIPQANTKHLMLRRDVVEAVAAGKFHIYAVTTIDQGIELLTGIPAGAPDEAGNYPEDSINGRVQKRLRALAARQRRLTQDQNGKDPA